MADKYNHTSVEKKWQEEWAKQGVYTSAADKTKATNKKKRYVLDMFPYPSGSSMHVGHLEGYVGTDILSRYFRMKGFNVLHPMGWDAFGLPAENYAIKTGIDPNKSTHENIKTFKRQLESSGLSYDWDYEIDTSSPEFYKWTQWLFIQMFKAGLAYKKKAPVNWCPKDETVLANEQVEDGLCERCGTPVIQKELDQWFLKITDYADRLIAGLDKIDWPEEVKVQQRNWIGKTEVKKKVSYHIRDWLISRQRYWGCPIPMVYCEDDGWQAVPDSDLPVLIPTDVDYRPHGQSPLATSKTFQVGVKCPKCGKSAKREVDTMDTYVDSSWYFIRFADPNNKKEFASAKAQKSWLPVDDYVGGGHVVQHLLFARFFWKVLYDAGLIDKSLGDEPFLKLRAPGWILGADSRKMSKRWGNVVTPDDIIPKFGADTLRVYEMFMGPFDVMKPWSVTGVEGASRFLGRVWRLFNQKVSEKDDNDVTIKMHQTVKKVTEDIEGYKFNTAISTLMEFVNLLNEKGGTTEIRKNLCLLLAPFAPHLSEEIWVNVLGEPFSVHRASWPSYEAKYTEEKEVLVVIQVNGRLRGQMNLASGIASLEEKVTGLAKKDENVKKWLEGKKIKKTIFISGKLVNFVV
jgi:leucyl-tRNA synthetase